MRNFFRSSILILLVFQPFLILAQGLVSKRTTLYAVIGTSGAELNQFNRMLSDRGLSPLRNRYHTLGLGYQNRLNDFVFGAELYHNRGNQSDLDGYNLGHRSSRFLLNVGYAFTEESRFQLIHYMSLGVGFLNFQMLKATEAQNLPDFLANPERGFILRENDIQRGTMRYGDFLTEIGFQLSYDFDLPRRKEALAVIAKLGYAFSPIEGKWTMSGMSFQNAQSGAFLRVGAGLTIPDRNFFYKDASMSFQLVSGIHFTKPNTFNSQLVEAGLEPLEGMPRNLGLKITGENEKLLYGVEVFNLAMDGDANSLKSHSLNSLRIYANGGWKLIEYRNMAIHGMGGIGYGNIRYTLSTDEKPDFPELFQQRDYDGYLKNSGLMAKPELSFEYAYPITKRKLIDLVFTTSVGYELALANYRLAELDMAGFMTAPYVSFGFGIRP
ncbi:hypothetical protein OU792_15465 [Algoriphagus sp. NF]|uniref:hypothetical protein n=1 Tax=Algoriphagus sp. NF TaxID=2992756 RepID=UPI00237A4FC4|nr:hypothetical protein [Algoriphagus sp. NF]MDE0561395.1 hypothetical protein [Algoriphagus sp. NF]